MNLLHVLRNGHEAGHGAEGLAQVVRIQAGDDDADAPVSQFLANLNERQLEEWVEKELSEGRRHHWMTEQLMSIKVVCGPDYQNRGKSLRELNWGDLLHVKVIKLLHGQTCHIIPEGRIRVDAGDRMVITGSGTDTVGNTAAQTLDASGDIVSDRYSVEVWNGRSSVALDQWSNRDIHTMFLVLPESRGNLTVNFTSTVPNPIP